MYWDLLMLNCWMYSNVGFNDIHVNHTNTSLITFIQRELLLWKWGQHLQFLDYFYWLTQCVPEICRNTIWIQFCSSRSYPTGERLSGVGGERRLCLSPIRCPVVGLSFWNHQNLIPNHSSLIIIPNKKTLTKKTSSPIHKSQKSWQRIHDLYFMYIRLGRPFSQY